MIYDEYRTNKNFSLIRTFLPNTNVVNPINNIIGDDGNGQNSIVDTNNIYVDIPSNQLQFNVTENYSDNDKSFNINSYYAYITFHNYSCQYDNNYSYVSLTLHNKTTYINNNQTYFISLSNIGIINYNDKKLWYKPDIIEFGNTYQHSAHIYFDGTVNDGLYDGWFQRMPAAYTYISGHESQSELRKLLYDTLVYPASYYSDNLFNPLSGDSDLHKHITASYIISNINEYPSYIYQDKSKNKFDPYLNYIRDFNDNYHLYIYTYTYISNFNGLLIRDIEYINRGSFILPGSQKQTTTNNEYKKVTLWDLKTTDDYFSDTNNKKGIKRISYFISYALCEAGCSRPSNNGIYTYHLYSASINNPTAYTYHIGDFCLMESYFVSGASQNNRDGFDDDDHAMAWAKNKDYLKSFIYVTYNDGTGTQGNPHFSYIKVGLDFFLREGEDILPQTNTYYTDLIHKDANYRYNLALYNQYLYGYDIYNSTYIRLDNNSHNQLFSYIDRLFNNNFTKYFLKKTTVTSPCLFNLFLYNTYTGESLSDTFWTKDNIKEIETVSNADIITNINKVSYNYNIKKNNDITYYIKNDNNDFVEFTASLETLTNLYFSFKSPYSYNIIPKYVRRFSDNSVEYYTLSNFGSQCNGDFVAYESSKPINGIDRNIITNMNIDLYDNMVVFEIWYNDKVYNYGTPSEKIIPINFYNSINTYYSDCFIGNKKFNIYKVKSTFNNYVNTPYGFNMRMNVSKQIPLFSSYMLKEETFNNENYLSTKVILYKTNNTTIEKDSILRKIYNKYYEPIENNETVNNRYIYDETNNTYTLSTNPEPGIQLYKESNKKSNILLDSNSLYDFINNSDFNTNDIKSVTILLGVDAPVSNIKFDDKSLAYIKSFYPEYIPIDENEDKSINIELYGTYYITSYNTSNITYLNYTNTTHTEPDPNNTNNIINVVDNNSYILTLTGQSELSNQEITNIGNNLYNLNVISQNDFINTKEIEFNISNVIGEYQYVKQENKNLDTFIKFIADTPITSCYSNNIPIHIEIPQYKKEHESDKYPL